MYRGSKAGREDGEGVIPEGDYGGGSMPRCRASWMVRRKRVW